MHYFVDGHLDRFHVLVILYSAAVKIGVHVTFQITVLLDILSPAYLTYMQSTSCKMPGWMKYRLESRFLGEISITSDMQMNHLYGRK